MKYVLPKLAENEKFRSVTWDRKGKPVATIEVFVRENLPEDKYWKGHTRFKLVSFEEV